MANKIVTYTQDPVISSRLKEINEQHQKQDLLEQQLRQTKEKLAEVKRNLAEKTHILNSLQIDFEHLMSLLTNERQAKAKEQPSFQPMLNNSSRQWIEKPVPGLATV